MNADWSPAGWLSFNYTLGLDYANDERTQGWPWSTSNTTVTGVNGVGGMNAGYIRTTQVDHNLTGTLKFALGQGIKSTLTLGQNLNSQNFKSRQVIGTGLIAAQPFNLGNTANLLPPYDFQQTVRLESYFVQATADIARPAVPERRDPERRRVNVRRRDRRNWFPKGSAAYVFRRATGESWLTYGKLRAAYGQSGTQPAAVSAAIRVRRRTDRRRWLGPGVVHPARRLAASSPSTTCRPPISGPERVKEFEAGVRHRVLQ